MPTNTNKKNYQPNPLPTSNPTPTRLRAMSGAGKTIWPAGYDALRVVAWAEPQLQSDYVQLVGLGLIDRLGISPAEVTQLVIQAWQRGLGLGNATDTDTDTDTNNAKINPADSRVQCERKIIADVRSELHKLAFYRRLGPGEPALFKWLFGDKNKNKNKNKANPNVLPSPSPLPFVVVEAKITEIGLGGGAVHLELLHLEETMRRLQLQVSKVVSPAPTLTVMQPPTVVAVVGSPVSTQTQARHNHNGDNDDGDGIGNVAFEGLGGHGHGHGQGNLPVAAMRALQLAQTRLLQSQSPSQDDDDEIQKTSVSVNDEPEPDQELLPELEPVALDTGTGEGVSVVAAGAGAGTDMVVSDTNDTSDSDSDNTARVTSSTPTIKVRAILLPAEQIRQQGQRPYEIGQHLFVAVDSCELRSTQAYRDNRSGGGSIATPSPLVWHASHRSPDVVAGLLRQYVPEFGLPQQPQQSSQQAEVETEAEAKLEIVDIAREAGRLCKVAVRLVVAGLEAGPHSNFNLGYSRNNDPGKGKGKGGYDDRKRAFARARVLGGLDLQPVLDRLPTGEQLILVEWSADALQYQANALNWQFWSGSNSTYSEHHQHHYQHQHQQHANNGVGSLGGLRLTCEPKTEDGSVGVDDVGGQGQGVARVRVRVRVQVQVEQARDIGRLIGRGGVNVRLAEQLTQCHYKFVVDTGTGTGTSNNVGVDQTQPQSNGRGRTRKERRRQRQRQRQRQPRHRYQDQD